MNAKKGVLLFLIGTVVHLYTTFVVQLLWNWFAAAALHVPEISFWTTFGLLLLVRLVLEKPGIEETKRWEWLETVLRFCVPDHKQDELAEEIKTQKQLLALEIGLVIFTIVFADTVTLVIGWGVHTFLV